MMRTKSSSRKDSGTASSSASASVVLAPLVVKPMITMPNVRQQLAKATQEARDLAASPPSLEASPEQLAEIENESAALIKGANDVYDQWFASYKTDFKNKNRELKDCLLYTSPSPRD